MEVCVHQLLRFGGHREDDNCESIQAHRPEKVTSLMNLSQTIHHLLDRESIFDRKSR